MEQRILLITTLRWPFAARLAIAFTNLGCHVEGLSPADHPFNRTCAVRKTYRYSFFRPLASLRAAIHAARPDLVIPCDDTAAVNLQALYESTYDVPDEARMQRAIIERSLGSPAACTLATTRAPLLALAAQQGVRVPKTSQVAGTPELSAWLVRRGFPAVLKVDNSWGGQGVSIVYNHEQGLHAFRHHASGVSARRTLRRLVVERDSSALLDWSQPAHPKICVQDYIPGMPANRAVACWRGQVLAGISVEAIQTLHSTGPATVIRVVQNSEMKEAAERLVGHLGLSGFWGLDFILEEKTSAAYFIEMNPRATPICHLALGAGQDLPAALCAQIGNPAPAAAPAVTEQDVIALFPGEWHRDPASPYLRSAYHDIPWEEAALVQDGLKQPWSERGLVARGLARHSSKQSRLPTKPENSVRTRLMAAFNTKYVR